MFAEVHLAQWWRRGRSGNLCAQVRASLPRLSGLLCSGAEILLSLKAPPLQPQDLPPVTQGLNDNVTEDGLVFGRFVAIFTFPNFLNITARDPPPPLHWEGLGSEVITAPTPSLSKIWTCGAASKLPTQKDPSVIRSSGHQWAGINKVLNEDGLFCSV